MYLRVKRALFVFYFYIAKIVKETYLIHYIKTQTMIYPVNKVQKINRFHLMFCVNTHKKLYYKMNFLI